SRFVYSFFFSSRRRHTRFSRDWSSDVCSSDLSLNLQQESFIMCGIVAYVGQQDALTIIIKGLKRLEYRGYDSAGIALLNNKGLEIGRASCRERVKMSVAVA